MWKFAQNGPQRGCSREREETMDGEVRFFCLATHPHGAEFLRAAAALGVRATLLTLDGLREADWPREALEDLATMPAGMSVEQVLNTVSWMARSQSYHRVIALDAGDLLLAAALREHLRIPGMGLTTAGYYRDRLAMRIGAGELGFATGEFTRVLNEDELRGFVSRVAPPWRLLPRRRDPAWASFRIDTQEALWVRLAELGDAQSRYLLESMTEGDRFWVFSIINEGTVVFSVALQRGQGTASAETLTTVDRGSRTWMELTAINAGLTPSLGLVRGLACARFVQCAGGFLLEEVEAGIGEDGLVRVVRAATGIDLWREWARLELAQCHGEHYVPGEWFEKAAGAVRWPSSSERAVRLNAVDPVERFCDDDSVGGVVRADSAAEVSRMLARVVG